MFNPKGTFREQLHVGFYECDFCLRQRPAALIRRVQESGEKQLESLGMGYKEVLKRHSQVFLLSQLILRINRLPLEGEEVELSTCPMGSKGARFYREATVTSGDGERLASIYTSWSLFDPAARQVLRPSAFPYELENGVLDIDYREFRFKTPQGAPIGERVVRYSDLDSNGHMNNAVYFDVICDALPLELLRERMPSEISIYYQHEAAPNTCMSLCRADETDDVVYLYGEVEGRRCFESRVVFTR